MSMLKSKIMRHLSEHGPATVHDASMALSNELGVSQDLIKEAMCDMIQRSQLKRMAGPEDAPPGKIDGKYGSFNEKRMESDAGVSPKSGTFEDNPWQRDIKGPKAV